MTNVECARAKREAALAQKRANYCKVLRKMLPIFLSASCEESYICFAIDSLASRKLISRREANQTQRMIMDRLDTAMCLESWLVEKCHLPRDEYWLLTAASPTDQRLDPKNILKKKELRNKARLTRVAWIKSMLVEFSQ